MVDLGFDLDREQSLLMKEEEGLDYKTSAEAKSVYEDMIRGLSDDELRIMAIVAEQAERYDDMLAIAKVMVEKKVVYHTSINEDEIEKLTLTSDERILISVPFNKIVAHLRQQIEYLTAVE